MRPAADHFDAMTLFVGATRYYLGRMSYAVSGFCDSLVATWPSLRLDVREVIARDVEREFERDDAAREDGDSFRPLGHDCDRESWAKVRALWTTEPVA